MRTSVQNIKPVVLYLLLVMSGLFAGIHFLSLIAPIETKMSAAEFGKYWQLLDGFMGKRMPVFGLLFLALFAVNLILFLKYWKSLLFWILVIGLLLLVFDLVLTISSQISINQQIQSIDIQNLNNEQISTLEEL